MKKTIVHVTAEKAISIPKSAGKYIANSIKKIPVAAVILTLLALFLTPVNSEAGSFNGSGTFVRSYNWTNDASNNIDMLPSRFDTEDNGFATGLSTCITKDGQQTLTNNIPFNNFRITGAGNPVGLQDYMTAFSVLGENLNYGANVTGTNTITFTTSPAITGYVAGQVFFFAPTNDNTGSATVNIDSVGALTVYKSVVSGIATLVAGDLEDGIIAEIIYDGTEFQLLNPQSGVIQAGAVLANGVTATTQSAADSTAKVATTGFVNGTALTLATGTTAVTQSAADSSTKVATDGFVNGTALTLANGTTAVTQSASDTSTKVATTAFVQPISAKAYVAFNASGVIQGTGYNVSSVTVNSAGSFTVNFANSFSDANYIPQITVQQGSGGVQLVANVGTPTTSSLPFITQNRSTGANTSPIESYVVVYGN